MAPRTDSWQSLRVAPEELRLDTTLKGGQSFRWIATGVNEWTTAFRTRIVSLRQTADDCEFCDRTPPPPRDGFLEDEKTTTRQELHAELRDYFQLDVSLAKLYRTWSESDPHFAWISSFPSLRGVRVLRQDPAETLLGFICSSNNNVARIEKMVMTLCERYGEFIGEYAGRAYHAFPTIAELASRNGLEGELREAGFGYRAKYIAKTVRKLQEEHGCIDDDEEGEDENDHVSKKEGRRRWKSPEEWLFGLRKEPYADARTAIMALDGVGPKVADCICLMALDKSNAVPVDTHVWQIACRDYGFNGAGRKRSAPRVKGENSKPVKSKIVKGLTPKLYVEIIQFFAEIWGPFSGWAHTVLFIADLKSFEDRTKIEIVEVKSEITSILKDESEVKLETRELVEEVHVKRERIIGNEENVFRKKIKDDGKLVDQFTTSRRVTRSMMLRDDAQTA